MQVTKKFPFYNADVNPLNIFIPEVQLPGFQLASVGFDSAGQGANAQMNFTSDAFVPPQFKNGATAAVAAALSPDQQYLVWIGKNGQLQAFNFRRKQYLPYGVIETENGMNAAFNLKEILVSPNGQTIFINVSSSNKGEILVYDIENQTVVTTLTETDNSPFENMTSSPDARILVTGSKSGHVSAWLAE